jgi:hypothetical protein
MWPKVTVLVVPSDAKGTILGRSNKKKKKKTRKLEAIDVPECAFMFFLIV